jgi:amino-acid N-acetyltransferase
MKIDNFDKNSDSLRDALSYISADVGHTIVIHLDFYFFKTKHFNKICADITQLFSIGIKIILVFDVYKYHQDEIPISNKEITEVTKNHTKKLFLLQKTLNMVPIVNGNFIKPISKGVINGKDLLYNGRIKNIHNDRIEIQSAQNVVLLSNLAISDTKNIYLLSSVEIAQKVATAINAVKLIFLSDLSSVKMKMPTFLTSQTHEEYQKESLQLKNIIKITFDFVSCNKARAHILDYTLENSLLKELFTRTGCGILVASDKYDYIRGATSSDIDGIFNLIEKINTNKQLISKTRTWIKNSIKDFLIMEIDGFVVSCLCCKINEKEQSAFISSMATHKSYQRQKRADKLLKYAIKNLKKSKINKIFTQSTQSVEWFVQRGFGVIKYDRLPPVYQKIYDRSRNSKILQKLL